MHSKDVTQNSREAVVRANGTALVAAQAEVTMSHAQSAVLWISYNRPDITLGVEPTILLVGDDDAFSLAELEDYGRAGNAVNLCEGPFGELWWCDPLGLERIVNTCLLYAATTSHFSRREVVLRYFRAT
jgi:hypothetical protein